MNWTPNTVLQLGPGPDRWAITTTGLRTPEGLEIPAGKIYYNLALLEAPPSLLATAATYFGLPNVWRRC